MNMGLLKKNFDALLFDDGVIAELKGMHQVTFNKAFRENGIDASRMDADLYGELSRLEEEKSA